MTPGQRQTHSSSLPLSPSRSFFIRRLLLRARLFRKDLGPAARRLIDIGLTMVGLVVLSPVFAIAAIAIKLSSKGPVFFYQERVGVGGRVFRMPKLRSMIVNAAELQSVLAAAEDGAMDGVRFKLKSDPRITRVGRFLRRYSVDELPQLWSVLIGDMSVIGPRPPVPSEVRGYNALAARRLEVTPGLTCKWQVGGRSDLSFSQQVDLDIAYIDCANWWDEIKILLATIPAVLTGRGAY